MVKANDKKRKVTKPSKKAYSRAKTLRKISTVFERKLWRILRDQDVFHDYKFRRQHPIGPYIVDFICIQQKLILEIDGDSHSYQQKYDQKRDEYLHLLGYKVMRFSNLDINLRLEGVIDVIRKAL